MTLWCPSSWMAKMRGNTIPSPAGNSCAASTMRCSARPASRPPRFPRPFSGTSSFPGSSRWFRAPGFTPTSTSGLARRKTTAPGTISTTPATSMPRPLPRPSEAQRKLAFEEILIAEGSDWNWWYGPEHHSANDREFDELYRKHLSNIYQLLGSRPPDYLSQPITRRRGAARGAAADRLYSSPDHRRHGALLRMDGGRRLHRRPARRRHARQTISARLRFTRESTTPTSTGASTLPRIKFQTTISNWWSTWNPGRMKASAPRRALRLDVGVEAAQNPKLEGQRSRCRQPLASL